MSERPNVSPDLPQAGFNIPRPPKDGWVKQLFERHDLGETPSLADIEPVAQRLLGGIETMQEGAELVLGRRLSSDPKNKDDAVLQRGLMMMPSPKDRFGILVLQVAIEEKKVNQKKQ